MLAAAPCSRSRMTRGGGSGSRRGRGSRDPVAAHGGWAPLAPPREAPARSGTRPPRGRRAGPRRVAAAAAAMSPGKPGAGGAGTRRTGWRRRRRRRRLEAAGRAPGLGRSAGPDSRGPGTFQGARGMKPAAREARPPRRSLGLRWALPPLLLLCRLGQVSGRGPGRGWRAGRSWHLRHLPAVLARGVRRGARARVLGPSPGGRAGTWPASPPSPFPACPAPEGGRRAPGSRGAGAPPAAAPRAPGRLWPALPGPGAVWPARLARPRRPEGACVPRAPRAERGRPGLQGPRGRAEGQRRRPGRGAGPPGRGRGARPPGKGTASGASSHPGREGRSPASLQRTVPFPGRRLASLGVYFVLCGLRSPPTALCSRFAFQIMLRLAIW